MNKIIRYACTIAAVVIASASNGSELLQNGDFSAGLVGWTSYLTANGTISPTMPNQGGVPASNSPAQVQSFDVSGAGASNAAWLNAGQYLGPYGTANPAGGGIFQSFSSAAGLAIFTADVAFTTRLATDYSGIFSVLLDGVSLDNLDFGQVGGTSRGKLGFATNLSAGAHMVSLQVVRPFAPAVGLRSEYFDNVSLNLAAAAVPEPATWLMMLVGFGGIGFTMRRGSNVRMRSSHT